MYSIDVVWAILRTVEDNITPPRIWKGVSVTLWSGRYTLSYPRGRIYWNCGIILNGDLNNYDKLLNENTLPCPVHYICTVIWKKHPSFCVWCFKNIRGCFRYFPHSGLDQSPLGSWCHRSSVPWTTNKMPQTPQHQKAQSNGDGQISTRLQGDLTRQKLIVWWFDLSPRQRLI